MKRALLAICILFMICALEFGVSFAEEITILYTGESHAMLYPCSCPKEPDGGVSRRLALIKQLRKKDPNILLLDSGGFFAGGILDEYTQNAQLDMQRTEVNLKAMGLMKYDAVALGDEEFNFGRDFLQEKIAAADLPVVSCNISVKNGAEAVSLFKPYLIKEFGALKVGITGVTALSAMNKTQDFSFIDPKAAVSNAVQELKANGAGLIVLLSRLSEGENINLVNAVSGIDILIASYAGKQKTDSPQKIGSTLVLKPSWQARKLGKLSLAISSDKKITGHKFEELRLSDKIKDDPEISAVLPRCFSDAQCKKEGLAGICQNPGASDAKCLFSEAQKIKLLVIEAESCRVCDSKPIVNHLKGLFPGLAASYLYFPEANAAKAIKEFDIRSLPAYLLDKAVEKEKAFDSLKENTVANGSWYMLKPQFTGVSFFPGRKRAEGKIDVFLSLYDKHAAQLLDTLKDFSPSLHFMAAVRQEKFEAPKGNLEVEEYLRAACVQKYYPQKFWDYLFCRAKHIDSSWWEDCLGDFDSGKIKTCARSDEAAGLLQENINLNRELEVMSGPTYLLDNQEIFSISGTPTKEDFKKIFNRK